jgi:hypothetical protein
MYAMRTAKRQSLKNFRRRASSIPRTPRTTNPAWVEGAVKFGRSDGSPEWDDGLLMERAPNAVTGNSPASRTAKRSYAHAAECRRCDAQAGFGRQAHTRSILLRAYEVIFGTPPQPAPRKLIRRNWLNEPRLPGAVRLDMQEGYGVRCTIRESTRFQSGRACVEPIGSRENKNH